MRRLPAFALFCLVTSPVLATCAVDASATDAITSSAVVDSAAHRPQGEVMSGVTVERVVDGDTIQVSLGGRDVTVRMIGINTPETVKPHSPVECFGPQASEFTKGALTGRTITLEFDASQGRTDQYGRTLAYVWLPRSDGRLRLFNLIALAGGYAYERQYGPTPYAWKKQFRVAQQRARAASAGLWGACAP